MIRRVTLGIVSLVTALLLVTAYAFNSMRMLDDFDLGDED